MSNSLQFETPENVQIEHQPAGIGTRFIAWFVDGIIVNVLIFLAFVGLVLLGAIYEGVFRDLFNQFDELVKDEENRAHPETVAMYFIGIGILVYGFGSFLYFGLSELLWRGQTLGKRLSHIRVVKSNGFALDAGSIFVRNIFRIVDQWPILWIVPLLSTRGQRFGDMVAGTIVIREEFEDLSQVRQELSVRNSAEVRFRFDNAKLGRLSRDEIDAIEQILDRWNSLPQAQKDKLLDQMVSRLCKKMQTEEPPTAERVVFLEDLLAAEYKRQDRQLR